MNFRLVNNQKEWDEFVGGQKFSQFLQSWSWGEFQKAYGRRVWRVGMFAPRHSDSPMIIRGEESCLSNREILRRFAPQDDVLVGAAQIVEHYLGLGMGYLYCSRGLVFSLSFRAERGIPNNNALGIRNYELGIREWIEFLKKEIINYGTLFLRIEPNLGFRVQDIGYRIEKVRSIQPAHVLLLDLSKPEEELLVGMHPKTRYNIRLAERKGLEFGVEGHPISFPRKRESSPTANQSKDLDPRSPIVVEDKLRGDDKYRKYSPVFDTFWHLLQETAKRDKIRLHAKKYYQLMGEILGQSSNTKYLILNTKYSNQWLAAGIFIGFGDTFAYVHGASANQRREMMAPHLLHWRAMQFAKKTGYHYYDFGGINPEDKNDFDYRPAWEGITRFKKGFGGFVHSHQGTYDVVLNGWGYKIYQMAKVLNFKF